MVEDDLFSDKTFQTSLPDIKGGLWCAITTSGPDGIRMRRIITSFANSLVHLRQRGRGVCAGSSLQRRWPCDLRRYLPNCWRRNLPWETRSVICNTMIYSLKRLPIKLEGAEQNLNLPRLFVLTSNRTTGFGFEAVINGLRPYYDVYLLGEQTEGKNVGSITLTNDKYDYELHPIVCRIFNVQDQSEYKDGFSSDWEPDEPNSDYRPIVNHVELGIRRMMCC